MNQRYNPRLRRALMEVVTNQLRDGKPPETAETLARLIAEGRSREEAMELIACVVCAEIFDILSKNQLYDEDRYVAGLSGLPRLPWESVAADGPEMVRPAPRRKPSSTTSDRRKMRRR